MEFLQGEVIPSFIQVRLNKSGCFLAVVNIDAVNSMDFFDDIKKKKAFLKPDDYFFFLVVIVFLFLLGLLLMKCLLVALRIQGLSMN